MKQPSVFFCLLKPVDAFEAENDSAVLFGVVTCSHVGFMRAVKLLDGGWRVRVALC